MYDFVAPRYEFLGVHARFCEVAFEATRFDFIFARYNVVHRKGFIQRPMIPELSTNVATESESWIYAPTLQDLIVHVAQTLVTYEFGAPSNFASTLCGFVGSVFCFGGISSTSPSLVVHSAPSPR